MFTADSRNHPDDQGEKIIIIGWSYEPDGFGGLDLLVDYVNGDGTTDWIELSELEELTKVI